MQEATAALRESARYADIVELRLDLLPCGAARELVIASPVPVIATCRRRSEGGAFDGSAREALSILEQAVAAGARYVDLDIRTARAADIFMRTRRTRSCPTPSLAGARVILSYHSFGATPRYLRNIVRRLLSRDCRIVKIAITPKDTRDVIRLLETAQTEARRARRPAPAVIPVAMGETGLFSRILYRRFGAPWCYAMPVGRNAVSPGQGKNSERPARRDSISPYSPPDHSEGRDGIPPCTAPGQIDIRTMRTSYRSHIRTRKTRVFAVIGDPLTHTRSPTHFNGLFARNMLDAVFIPLRLARVTEFPAVAKFLQLRGVSITMPFKEEILKYLSAASPAARFIGAVNTVVAAKEGYVGHNTDAQGTALLLRAAMRRLREQLGAAGKRKGMSFRAERSEVEESPLPCVPEIPQFRPQSDTAVVLQDACTVESLGRARLLPSRPSSTVRARREARPPGAPGKGQVLNAALDAHRTEGKGRVGDRRPLADARGSDLGATRFLAGSRAIVLGAGGVAKAVVYALVNAGATVIVSNRTFERAVSLASVFGCIPVPWEGRAATQVDIVVNATAVGMACRRDGVTTDPGDAKSSSALPFPAERLRPAMIVMDCVHTPEETRFVCAARAKHCEVITGVDLFIAQAGFQWRLFRDSLSACFLPCRSIC